MLQNPCKTYGFKKNMIYKIPPGGGKPYPASGLLYAVFFLPIRLKLKRTVSMRQYTYSQLHANSLYFVVMNRMISTFTFFI